MECDGGIELSADDLHIIIEALSYLMEVPPEGFDAGDIVKVLTKISAEAERRE